MSVDEAAWSALYSNISRPFDPPATGNVGVKVINHYGDKVLQAYKVRVAAEIICAIEHR